MTITVVIPALDEEAGIGRCLDNVVAQGSHISAIVVVDNNSTDATAAIVAEKARVHRHIRLISETTPGLSHARYAGFDAAESEIIAGIDADTAVGAGWAEAIIAMFADHPTVGAGTGPAVFYDMPGQKRYRRRAAAMNERAAAAAGAGTPMDLPQVSGANTALRTAAWKSVRDSVSYRRDVYEDLDLSINLVSAGWSVVFVPGMTAEVSGRRMLSGPRDFIRYGLCIPRTYRMHGKRRMAALATLIVLTQTAINTAKLPSSRSWDPTIGRHSLRRLRHSGAEVRVPPVGAGLG